MDKDLLKDDQKSKNWRKCTVPISKVKHFFPGQQPEEEKKALRKEIKKQTAVYQIDHEIEMLETKDNGRGNPVNPARVEFSGGRVMPVKIK